MSQRRSPWLFASLAVTLQLGIPSVLRGQVAGGHDHGLFECADDGLSRTGTTGFGCQRLAKYDLPRADAPLFWHLAKVRSKATAKATKGQATFVVDAAGQGWLFSFGPEDAAPKQGHHVATVGPLQLASVTRRALFIVIHDAAQPWGGSSDWKPSEACGAD